MVALEEIAEPHFQRMGPMLCTVEILTIGNELLTGKTVNTNAAWLAKSSTSIGGLVTRATTVRDNLTNIGAAVREILKRKPAILLISGGLGPTFDDMTLQALARSTKRPLVINKIALHMVREKYRSLAHRHILPLTNARKKMAIFPKGAKPLPNPIGTAPGVLLHIGRSTIICLPGVPSELRSMFEASVSNIVSGQSAGFGRKSKSVHVSGVFESEIAPIIDRVMRKNPGVYIKSHPGGREGRTQSKIELEFSFESSELLDAKKKINYAITDMLQNLSGKGKILK